MSRPGAPHTCSSTGRRPAVGEVLAVLGTLEPGTELVADHMLPPADRDEAVSVLAHALVAG